MDLRTPVAGGWIAISADGGWFEMFASSAAPHRICFSRADVRRAHGRSALSDLAHCTQPRCTLDFNVRLLRCYYAYGAPETIVSTVSAQNVSDHPADLDGDRRDRLSGGCADKALAAGDPPATIIGGPSSGTRTGSQPPLRKLWDTRSATPGFEDPPPRSEGIIVMGNGSGMVGMWWFWLFGLLVVLGIALVVVVRFVFLAAASVGAAPPVWAARHRCRVRRAGSSISGTPAVS